MKGKTAVDLEQLIELVRANPDYAAFDIGFVRAIAEKEALKGRNLKDTVKAVRTVLHQAGGAYLPQQPDYAQWRAELAQLPADPQDEALRRFCLQKMQAHASTRERAPHMQAFSDALQANLPVVESLLDLACGLNPLAYPFLPIKPQAAVFACDIYPDLVEFSDILCHHLGFSGKRFVCDLTSQTPAQQVQVAFLLKTLPCLELVFKGISEKLLREIQAERLVISFPAFSLGGRKKGMTTNYRDFFLRLAENLRFQTTEVLAGNELLFFVKK